MNKIKKGDEVIVITGKDKGKRGRVLKVFHATKKLLVDGINAVKKHVKANPDKGEKGGVVAKFLPIQDSYVMLYDPVTKKGSRVGIRILEDGRKVRYFKSTNEVVDVDV
jgi:large subunit ribosomal protein L24